MVKISKILDFIAKSSSVQMYKNKLCVTVKRIDEKLTSENLFKVVMKNKKSHRKTRFFCPY